MGAALGYLLSQKNLEKASHSGQPPSAEIPTAGTPGKDAGLRAGDVPTAAAMTPAVAAVSPVSAPERLPGTVPVQGALASDWRTTPAPEWNIPPAPPAEWRPAPVPAPTPTTSVSATPVVPVAPAAPSPAVETPAVSESSVAYRPSPAETARESETTEPAAPVTQPSDSEIILTRDFLEEPLPGSGWTSTAALAVEEGTLDDASGVVPDVIVSRVGSELGLLPVESREPVAPESAEQMIEESVAELPVVEELVELPAVEESVELPMVEESVTDIVSQGRGEVEALAEAATVVEQIPVVEGRPLADSARVDDLKSRIEETRRRIRHELEQPFDTSGESKPPERDWTVSPVVPVVEEVAVEEVAVEETVIEEPIALEPAVEEPVTLEPVAAEPVAVGSVVEEPVAVGPSSEESLELVVESGEVDTGLVLGLEEPIDYDSMKDRIESTRSRLKAKAFDAMMTGESALLGRDIEGADRAQQRAPGVDSEVDETIETSLREEEE